MSDQNSYNVVGRLTRDAELKYTQGGFAITTFTLANSERVKKGEQWEDYTNYLDCKILGKMGESVSKYLVKGKQVALTAHMHQDRWEKDGQKQSRLIVMVDNLQLIGSNDGKQAQPAKPESTDTYDSDIPF